MFLPVNGEIPLSSLIFTTETVRRINLPNKITLFRIFVIPLIVLFLINPSPLSNLLAALVFSFAAITDWLDGHLARTTNQVTELGKLLDPIADKLLILSAMVPLVALHRLPAWIAVIILAREFAVSGLRSLAALKGVVIPADTLGKYKVGAEIAGILFLILNWNFLFVSFHVIGNIAMFIAMLLALVSGFLYFQRYWENISVPDTALPERREKK